MRLGPEIPRCHGADLLRVPRRHGSWPDWCPGHDRAGYPGTNRPGGHGTRPTWCQASRFPLSLGAKLGGGQGPWGPRDLGGEGSTQRGTMVGPIKHDGPAVWGGQRPWAARRGRGVLVRSVAITNAKGGVGKSTTAINLGAALEEVGRRVLLVDADPSGNAALGLFPRGAPAVGLADAMLGNLKLDEVAVCTAYPGLNVVPPGDRLSLCSEQMGGTQGLGQGREFRIRRLLKGLSGYDVVVVDTSPVLTPLNVAILYAVAE